MNKPVPFGWFFDIEHSDPSQNFEYGMNRPDACEGWIPLYTAPSSRNEVLEERVINALKLSLQLCSDLEDALKQPAAPPAYGSVHTKIKRFADKPLISAGPEMVFIEPAAAQEPTAAWKCSNKICGEVYTSYYDGRCPTCKNNGENWSLYKDTNHVNKAV